MHQASRNFTEVLEVCCLVSENTFLLSIIVMAQKLCRNFVCHYMKQKNYLSSLKTDM